MKITNGFNPEYSEEAPSMEQLQALEGDIVLEFGAPWCGHCQGAAPAIKQMFDTKTQLPHIKVYDGKGKSLGRAFKIKLWPTLLLLRKGEELARVVRPTTVRECEALFDAKDAL